MLGAVGAASSETVTGRRLLIWTPLLGGVNLLMALAGPDLLRPRALVAVCVANILFNTVVRSLLQLCGAPEMRGPVMALHRLLNLGTMSIGAPLLGWSCAVAGAP